MLAARMGARLAMSAKPVSFTRLLVGVAPNSLVAANARAFVTSRHVLLAAKTTTKKPAASQKAAATKKPAAAKKSAAKKKPAAKKKKVAAKTPAKRAVRKKAAPKKDAPGTIRLHVVGSATDRGSSSRRSTQHGTTQAPQPHPESRVLFDCLCWQPQLFGSYRRKAGLFRKGTRRLQSTVGC